jgi:hypothetical protein
MIKDYKSLVVEKYRPKTNWKNVLEWILAAGLILASVILGLNSRAFWL